VSYLSLALREGQRMEMFKNRVLRGIFEPEMEKVIGE
jgi:hypothetical protein